MVLPVGRDDKKSGYILNTISLKWSRGQATGLKKSKCILAHHLLSPILNNIQKVILIAFNFQSQPLDERLHCNCKTKC